MSVCLNGFAMSHPQILCYLNQAYAAQSPFPVFANDWSDKLAVLLLDPWIHVVVCDGQTDSHLLPTLSLMFHPASSRTSNSSSQLDSGCRILESSGKRYRHASIDPSYGNIAVAFWQWQRYRSPDLRLQSLSASRFSNSWLWHSRSYCRQTVCRTFLACKTSS